MPWPALQSLVMDGWLWCALPTAIPNARIRSVPCPQARRPLGAAGAAIEDLYRRHGQTPIFRLTPFATAR